jgi:addiction module HigA family antidote
MQMHNPPHPGEILREMWLKPHNFSITKAAAMLKVSRKTLSEIVNERASLTPEMSVRLELALGKSAKSWLGHQAAYDLWRIEGRRAEFGIERISSNHV